MKKIFKKGVSVLLAALMACSIPYFAYAESQYDFTVESSSAVHYYGIQYEFTAKITDLPAQYLIEKTSTSQSAFSWSVGDGASVTSNNNYSVTLNEDNQTYTVTENATVLMPEPKSETGSITVKAEYNNSAAGSATSDAITLLRPITSITTTSDSCTEETRNNPAYHYFYKQSTTSGSDSFYIDAFDKETVTKASNGEEVKTNPFGAISYSVAPLNNDDNVTLTTIGFNSENHKVLYDGDNSVKVAAVVSSNTPQVFQLKFSPASGYKHEKIINVYVCIAATEFKLKTDDNVTIAYTKEPGGGTSTYTNKELTIIPFDVKPTYANDSFAYELFNNDGVTPCDQSWYSVTDDGKCKLNIKNAGTYKLRAYTVSPGNCIYRSLAIEIPITVNEISNIANIGIYEKNTDGNLNEGMPINSLEIYRSGSSSDTNIYDLSENLLFTDKNGNPPSGDYIDYQIADEEIATVDEKGVITALKAGTTQLTVSSHNSPSVFKTIDLTVVQLADSIKINTPITEIPQGHSVQLTTTLDPFDATEDISWSSNSDAIIIDENGYITANPNYNLSLNEPSVDVTIKAQTSVSNKSATTTIKVIPSNRATGVEIDANTISNAYDGFYEVDGEKITYILDNFTLKGNGYCMKGNEKIASTDVLTWRVKYEYSSSDVLVNFASKDYLGIYYNFDYSTATDTYTISPRINGKYTFYCLAVQRGHENDEITLDNIHNYVYDEFEVRVVDKISTIKNASVAVPTYAEGKVVLSVGGSDAYDPITVTSNQPLTADVVGYDEISKTVTILAGGGATSDFLPIISVTSRSGARATISVKVSNDINDAEVIITDDTSEYIYNGTVFKPEFKVFFGGREITTGFTKKYEDNLNAGTAKIILTGTGDFINSKKVVEFTIQPKTIDVKADADDKEYNTTATVRSSFYQITEDCPAPLPTLNVTDTERGRALTVNTDYEITAINNTSYGTATAIVTGIGNYTGSFEIEYTVRDDLLADYVEFVEIPQQTYTGTAITPEIVINYHGEVLDSKCYTVKYASNINKGTATATITGVSPYFTGTKVMEFEIVPIVIESQNPVYSAEVIANSNAAYGFYEKDDESIAYIADTFTIGAVGYDYEGKVVDCEHKWYFSCDNGEVKEIEIPEASKNNVTASTTFSVNGTAYFSFVYNYNSEKFTITPDKSKSDRYVYTFYCEATSGGTTATSSTSITMIPKPEMTLAATSTTTIPTKGTVYAVVGYKNSFGFAYSDVEITSSDPTIATVEKDANFDYNHTVIITANQDTSTMKTGEVTISAKNWDNQVKSIKVIVKLNIEDAVVTGGLDNIYDYSGAAIKPIPELTYTKGDGDTRLLVNGTDFTVTSYKNNTNAGEATIVLTGKGEFTGTKEVTFSINSTSISNGGFTITDTKQYYQISASNPAPVPSLKVVYNGKTLALNKDYTVTAYDNTKSGIATAIVTGIGNYSGTSYINFKVCDSIKNAVVETIPAQIYTGTAVTPSITLYYNGSVVSPECYTVGYSNNVNVGTATVTITGKTPDFSDKVTATFAIKKLASTKISKLTTKKKQLTVKWKKVSAATGYQVQYSTDKKFKKGNKSVTIKKNSTISTTVKKLKSKKTYYVRVRTYKTVNGKKVYSTWSAAKKIKVK